MSLLLSHFKQSLRRPDHWIYGSWLDTIVKYRKTSLGLLWIPIPIAVYIWGVGGFIGALQPAIDQGNFLAHVGVGFLIFRLMSTVILDATTLYASHQSYIYDGHRCLTDFILRCMSRSMFYFLLSLPLLVVAMLGASDLKIAGLGWSLLGLAVLLVNLFLYSVLFSLLGARFADLNEFMGSAILAAFLITPVVWYARLAQEGTTQGLLMRANPLHHLLEAVRAPLFGEQVEALTVQYLVVMTLVGMFAAAIAYGRFARRVPAWL